MKDGLISMKLKIGIERIGSGHWSIGEVARWRGGEVGIKQKSEERKILSKLF